MCRYSILSTSHLSNRARRSRSLDGCSRTQPMQRRTRNPNTTMDLSHPLVDILSLRGNSSPERAISLRMPRLSVLRTPRRRRHRNTKRQRWTARGIQCLPGNLCTTNDWKYCTEGPRMSATSPSRCHLRIWWSAPMPTSRRRRFPRISRHPSTRHPLLLLGGAPLIRFPKLTMIAQRQTLHLSAHRAVRMVSAPSGVLRGIKAARIRSRGSEKAAHIPTACHTRHCP